MAKSPYSNTQNKPNSLRHHVAIPENVMVLVDKWSEKEEAAGRPCRSRNDAVNKIVTKAVEGFKKETSK